MQLNYCRSSSYNTYKDCQHKYFLEYVLGISSGAGKSAYMGVVCHHVLELMARAKYNNHHLLEDKYSDPNYLLDICWERYNRENTEFDLTEKDFKFCVSTIEKVLFTQYNPLNLDIVATEKQFRIPLKEDRFKYEYVNKLGKVKQGYYEIRGTVDLVTKLDDDTLEIIDWKGLPLDTLLPTPEGWTTMGEVQIGDFLFDHKGNTTKVLGKSKVKERDCYQIEFDDKSSVICDDEHLWMLANNKTVSINDLKVEDKIACTAPLKSQFNKSSRSFDNSYIVGYKLANNQIEEIPTEYLRFSCTDRESILRAFLHFINPKRVISCWYNGNKTLTVIALKKTINSLQKLLLTLGRKTFKKDYDGLFDQIAWKDEIDNATRTIKNITKVEKQQTQCIMVDSPNKTYLCTEHMIPTHNTGLRRSDFATLEEKDYEYLCEKDFQLRMYDYAMALEYPEYKNRLLTIYFVNAGGPFTVSFSDEQREETLEMIYEHHKEVSNNFLPSRIKEVKSKQNWKCKYVCGFQKKTTKTGDNLCDRMHYYLMHHGMDKTVEDVKAVRKENENKNTELVQVTSNRRNIYKNE